MIESKINIGGRSITYEIQEKDIDEIKFYRKNPRIATIVDSLEEVTECARDLRNILEQGSLAEKKAFIRSFVQEITVLGEEARLTYIPPEIPPVHNEETEPVLSIVRHGGR